MKQNVTLKLDAEIIREAPILAAQRGSSISQLLADKLQELIADDRRYETARKRALARLRSGFDLGWKRPGSREELHER